MKTLIVGAAMIDILMKLDRLPKSGEDVLCSDSQIVIGGCAYNVASTLRNLGCAHDLCVPVGTGAYADMIAEELRRCGYDILIRDQNKDNGFTIDLVEPNGERTFITAQGIEGAYQGTWFESINMNAYDKIYVAGYQVCQESGKAIAGWLSGLNGKQLFFAPGPVICSIDPEVMEQIFSIHPVLHLNEKEALEYTGALTIQEAVRILYGRTGNLVIVTLGSEGAIYYNGQTIHSFSSVKTAVVDTIGAGDSHIGAVMGGLIRGYDMEKSMVLANRVAAHMVSVQGPVMSKEIFDEKMGEE